MNAPLLSIVVIFHNMRREAKRTLLSLSTVYQQGIDLQEYEVIAIDNGSDRPLDPEMVQSLGPQFRYHFHATDSVSPVDALNLGGRLAQGKFIALIVDGARMASPGLLRATINALRLSETPVICSLSTAIDCLIFQPLPNHPGQDFWEDFRPNAAGCACRSRVLKL